MSPRSIGFCHALTRILSAVVGTIGLSVLASRLFDAGARQSLVPGWGAMQPNTALALLLAAGALGALATSAPAGPAIRRRRWLGRAAAAGVAIVGALILVRHAFGLNSGPARLPFPGAGGAGAPWPGRMSPLAAADFLMLGSALLLISGRRSGAAVWAAQLGSLVAAFGAFVAVTGYLYGREALNLAPFFTGTALPTAAALLGLSVGVACARPADGLMALFNAASAGGTVLRRLLPPIVLLPVTINWLELEGERRGVFPAGFGWMLDTGLTVLLVGMLVWFVARVAHEKDVAREAAEAELRRSEERYRQLVEMSPVAIIVKDRRRIEFANPAARALVGATHAEEMVGKSPFAFVHPESRADFEHDVCRVLTDGTPLPPTEQRVLRLDGTEVAIEFSASAVDYHGQRFAQVVASDITERKLSAQALHASEERFQLLARTTGDAVWDWDAGSGATWWSQAFYEKFGYAGDTLPTFEAWLDHVHPEDRARAKAEFDGAVARQATGWSSEYRFRRADGSYGVIFDRVHGIRTAAGKLVRMIGSMVEITELRRLEEQARLLSHAVESTNEMISITGLDDRFLFVNRAFLDTYGYTRDEVLGRTPELLAPAAAKPASLHATIRRETLQQGWSGELINRRKDGTAFPVQLSCSPMRDGNGRVVALMGVARDITRQKQFDEILRASEERFRATFEQAAMGMTIAAIDGRYLRVNAKFCAITGFSEEEMLARTFQAITHPDDLEPDLDRMRRLLAGDLATYTLEKRYVRKDATPVWVELTASLVRRSDGAPDYFIALVEDITPRRSLETQLLHTQKMEAIGQLAGGVAHDFNNLLTAIQGHGSLLGMTPALPAPARDSLDEIMKAAHRATNLTRQLLLFSRREVIQPVRLNLNDAAAGIAKMLRRLIGVEVRLQLELHPQPLPVQADAGMIDQVLMNLAVNARDAMPCGGDLIVETTAQTVDAAMARLNPEAAPGRYACLGVSDTGSGIAPEVLPRIFEPFFTTKAVDKGTGLGLATVFGIVKQHRGWVKVCSEVGRGTTFRVFLPLATGPDTPAPPAEAPAAPPRGRGQTVLLVEDDAAVRTMTELMLARSGYRVLSTANGDDAVREWEKHAGRVDLLLTDLVMPGRLGGRELALELQARKPGLAVIFVSGYSAEIAGRELSLGAGQTFLQKPFEIVPLLETVDRLLPPRNRA